MKSNNVDLPVLPDLLNQILPAEEIGSATADSAIDTCKCHDTIVTHNAHAVITATQKRQTLEASYS